VFFLLWQYWAEIRTLIKSFDILKPNTPHYAHTQLLILKEVVHCFGTLSHHFSNIRAFDICWCYANGNDIQISVTFLPYWTFWLDMEKSGKKTNEHYILSKYQAMLKILQWNARQWKTPTLRIARSSTRNSVFIGHAYQILHRCIKIQLNPSTLVSK
jgi:hypothetical protein